MPEKILLREFSTIDIGKDKLEEYKDHAKPITVVGIIQRADAKNQNGRVYPYDILRKEVDRYMNEVVKKGVAMGQLDHIDSPVIELGNVSHIMEDVWWDGPEGKDVMGKIRLLDTPKGEIAKTIVRSGIPLGISSRAVGSISKNESTGSDVVGEDLQLVCWDLVANPSTHNSYLKIHEGFDPYQQSQLKSVRIKEALKELLRKK
jgi:hypothetical protein